MIVELHMAPDVAMAFKIELEQHRSHLETASEDIDLGIAEQVKLRIEFLTKAIQTIQNQIEGK